jgi:hypothetical protein
MGIVGGLRPRSRGIGACLGRRPHLDYIIDKRQSSKRERETDTIKKKSNRGR